MRHRFWQGVALAVLLTVGLAAFGIHLVLIAVALGADLSALLNTIVAARPSVSRRPPRWRQQQRRRRQLALHSPRSPERPRASALGRFALDTRRPAVEGARPTPHPGVREA